jgi:hypothetical protein
MQRSVRPRLRLFQDHLRYSVGTSNVIFRLYELPSILRASAWTFWTPFQHPSKSFVELGILLGRDVIPVNKIMKHNCERSRVAILHQPRAKSTDQRTSIVDVKPLGNNIVGWGMGCVRKTISYRLG